MCVVESILGLFGSQKGIHNVGGYSIASYEQTLIN